MIYNVQNKTTHLQQGPTWVLTYTILYPLFAPVSNILSHLGKHIKASEIVYKYKSILNDIQCAEQDHTFATGAYPGTHLHNIVPFVRTC